jgi:hypothetical protein
MSVAGFDVEVVALGDLEDLTDLVRQGDLVLVAAAHLHACHVPVPFPIVLVPHVAAHWPPFYTSFVW